MNRRRITPPFPLGRRNFLRLAGTSAAGLLVGCGRDPDLDIRNEETGSETVPDALVVPPEQTHESDAFPMGVASGDISSASVVLWTRYAEAHPLQCVVWEMTGSAYTKVAGRVSTAVAEGGFIHVDVQGLKPGARYRYAFFELKDGNAIARSAVGKFRAAFAADTQAPLVLGAISCVKLGHSFAPLMRAAERTDLDSFLLLGDTTYNDGARTLAQYRDRWLASLSTPEWKALRASTSVFATWDDHELANDWNPEETDKAYLAAAIHSWFENLPVRRNTTVSDCIYRSLRWGKTAEIFALDSKTERRPSKGTYLSQEQMAWLKAGLAESPARFKIIMNSVPIGEFPFPFTLFDSSRWTGFPAQRTEILTHVEKEKIPGVLWLSGDFHVGTVGRVAASGLGSTAVEVLAGPGAQNGNLAAIQLSGPPFDFATRTNNYVALHLDPNTGNCRVVFHDGAGETLADKTYRL